jgi:CPA2 family monovalent cation:H+ antiporter-2
VLIAATATDAGRLLELGGVVVVLALAARLAQRFGFSTIPLYLLAGVAVGAIARPTFSPDFTATTAEVGILLVLFTLGLEYSALELASGLRAGVRDGVIDFALNFPPGFVAALLLGWGSVAGLVLGGVTYVSSSGIIAKLVVDLGRVTNVETRPLLSLLVLEDLAMALYLPLLAVALTHAGPTRAVVSVAVALAVVGAVFVLALHRGELVNRVVWHESDEVLVLSALGLLLLVAGVSERVHVSGAIGAFLLGIALSGPVAERARAVVAPLRDVFAATFFFFFALQIDLGDVAPVFGPALALAFVSSATKIATGWTAARAVGADMLAGLRAGTALIARGEFSIVIAGLGVASGLGEHLRALAAAYVLMTAVVGPLASRYADTVGRALLEPRPGPAEVTPRLRR